MRFFPIAFTLSLLLFSCGTNDICFDSGLLEVSSTGGRSINSLSIKKNGKANVYADITSTDPKTKANSLIINNLPIGYLFENRDAILTSENSLFPNSRYEIIHISIEDADAGIIRFETDSLGGVFNLSNPCER